MISFSLSSQTGVLNFHQFTMKDGLTDDRNQFITTDRTGFTWISGENGLNRFDGVNNDPFKVNPNDSTSIKGLDVQSHCFEDQQGNIWFTTDEAINCYLVKSGNFRHYSIDSTGGLHYAFHLDNDGYLWVVKDKQLVKFNTAENLHERPQVIDTNFQVARAIVDTNEVGKVKAVLGCPWEYGSGIRVITFENNQVKDKQHLFNQASEREVEVVVKQVIHIKNSTFCFLTKNGLLFLDYTHPAGSQLYPFPNTFRRVRGLSKISNQVWLVNGSSKILPFALEENNREYLENQIIQAFNLDEHQAINNIDRIFLGKDSIVWLSAYNHGVFFANLRNTNAYSLFDYNNLSTLPTIGLYQISENNIWGVFSEKGKWTTAQINKNGKLENIIEVPRGFKTSQLSNSEIWAISDKGVAQASTGSFEWRQPYSLGENPYYCSITALSDHQLLIGIPKGILLYDTQNGKCKLLEGYDDWGWKIFIDSEQRLWINNLSNDVSVWTLDERSQTLKHVSTLTDLGSINHFVEDNYRQVIWLASSYGLIKVSTLNNQLVPTIYTESDGLINQHIQSVLLDKNSDLWVASNHGISHLIFSKEGVKPILHLTSADGLSTNKFKAGTALIKDSGHLWFGSAKGIDIIDPCMQEDIATTPKLVLKHLYVRVGNEDIEWKDEYGHSILDKSAIELEYSQNNLTFEFANLEYTCPKNNRTEISYILKGVKKTDVVILGDDNKFSYGDLKPGDYLFEFIAKNAEGGGSITSRKLYVTIHPHWAQTKLFQILLGVIFLIILLDQVSRRYRNKLRAQELELEKQKRLTEENKNRLQAQELELEKQRRKTEENKNKFQAQELKFERQKRITEEKRRIIERDQERIRLSKDLHDNLGSGLSLIALKSTMKIQPKNPTEMAERLLFISEQTTNLIDEMYDMIWTMDDQTSLEGLLIKIQNYSIDYLSKSHKKEVVRNFPGEVPELPITYTAKYHVFYTFKELLHNIIKYADANSVKIDITLTNDLLTIIVNDNGKGFDIDKINWKNSSNGRGNGLSNCRSRIKQLAGTINWDSSSSSGTTVTINLQLDHLLEK